MDGIITNLIGQGLAEKAQSSQQDAQDIGQQLQIYSYVLQDPDASPQLKTVAQQKLLGLTQKHGGKQAREAMPQLGNYLTALAMPSMIQGMQQRQRAAASARDRFGSQFRQYAQEPDQPPAQLPSPSGIPSSLAAEAAPDANVPAYIPPQNYVETPGAAGVADGAAQERAQVRPQPREVSSNIIPPENYVETPRGAAAGEPSAAPAPPSRTTLTSPFDTGPSLRTLAGLDAQELAQLGQLPPAHGIRQHIANALTRFAEGMGQISPQRQAQLQVAANIQQARAMLPLQIEQARQMGNFQLAQGLQQEHILQQAHIDRINQFYDAPETRQAFLDAGLTDQDRAAERLNAISQALGTKPMPERAATAYTLTNAKGERVNVLADKAGFVEIDPMKARELGDDTLVGRRKLDQIPGWSFGKAATVKAPAAEGFAFKGNEQQYFMAQIAGGDTPEVAARKTGEYFRKFFATAEEKRDSDLAVQQALAPNTGPIPAKGEPITDQKDVQAMNEATGRMLGVITGARDKYSMLRMDRGIALISAQTGLSTNEIYAAVSQKRSEMKSLNTDVQRLNGVDNLQELLSQFGDILIRARDDVDDTGSPVLNRWVQAGMKEIAGDEKVNRLNTAVNAISRVYAQLLSGGYTSTALTPVSSAADAKLAIQAAMTKGSVRGVVDQMRIEATAEHNTLVGRQRSVFDSLAAPFSRPGGGGGSPPPPAQPTDKDPLGILK